MPTTLLLPPPPPHPKKKKKAPPRRALTPLHPLAPGRGLCRCPGGEAGGELLYQGKVDGIRSAKGSVTANYIS